MSPALIAALTQAAMTGVSIGRREAHSGAVLGLVLFSYQAVPQ